MARGDERKGRLTIWEKLAMAVIVVLLIIIVLLIFYEDIENFIKIFMDWYGEG